jgi:hypothetical protein
LLNSYGFTEIKYENKKPFTCLQHDYGIGFTAKISNKMVTGSACKFKDKITVKIIKERNV